ncbi:MAG TPA: sodium:solute symporter family protein [Bacillota bacterium]|jgi:SSS family solute:Na+ symporter|nr:sodium:solute symporter family protein [Peptococcaceae bacterium MAG4]NLW39172.1 sodium:solute symporter family protein [Peptococcaceae bacterium]HPZ43637.1 sodium:solute symporter family protein [Bacillota bacterium]HQD75760.1 sodium:solute symporter family protein [Bacillota bacterium]HUM58931.1 sodium:solute symporter family protein [Bacillota bacterium]
MKASYIYLTVLAYFLLGTIVALYAKRNMVRDVSDFFIANRTISGFVAALTYSATTYSAFMLVGLAGLTYIGGVGAWGFELIYLSGLVLVAFFGPRFWLAGKKYNYITPSELLGDRYQSKGLQVVTAVGSIIFLIPYSAVQLIGIGTLMEGMSGGAIPFMAGLLIATFVAIIWAYIGGMRAVAWTDSLQALIMLIVSSVSVLFGVYGAFGGFGGLFASLEAKCPEWLAVPGPGYFNPATFVALALPWFFFSLSNPQVSQRLFIPRSLGAMRTMVMGFMVFGFIYTFVSIVWGLLARLLLPDLPSGDLATPSLLALNIIPISISLLVLVGITAAAISTINSIILTLSSMVSQDILKAMNPAIAESRLFNVGRLFVPLFAIVAFLFASLKLGLIAVLSVASSAGLLVIVPAIIGAFFWKRGTAAGAITSIVIGGIVAFWFQFGGVKPLGWGPGVWSGIIATVLFVVVSLLTTPPREKAEEFMTYINGALKENNAI